MQLSKTLFKPLLNKFTSPYELLKNGCFVQSYLNGSYYLLPLGMLVFNKITTLLRNQMSSIGAQETLIPLLHIVDKKSPDQFNTQYDHLIFEGILDRDGYSYNLAASPEQMYLHLINSYSLTEDQLPLHFFQFGKKFRDEPHTKTLLRLKQFTMLDSYSFHRDEKSLEKEYLIMLNCFSSFFNKTPLKKGRFGQKSMRFRLNNAVK